MSYHLGVNVYYEVFIHYGNTKSRYDVKTSFCEQQYGPYLHAVFLFLYFFFFSFFFGGVHFFFLYHPQLSNGNRTEP